MPRGASVDMAVTKVLVKNHIFWDKRSFVSLPNHSDGSIHVYLKGDDIKLARQRVWSSSRQRCASCKTELGYDDWEMDHKQGGTVGRCDCLHNLQALCRPCHRKKHVKVGFKHAVTLPNPDAAFPDSRVTRAKDARKIFEKLYPTGE